MAVLHANKENFHEIVMGSEIPVLVDFWASWCGPCKMVAPVMDQLSEEFEGKAKIVKVDIYENGELALEYGVMSIPTVIVFKDGAEADKVIGAYPKAKYAEMLEKQL